MLTIQPVNPHVNITSKLAIYYQVNQNVPVKQCAPGGNTKSQARDTLAFWEGSKFYTRLLFSSATLPSGQRSLLLRRRDFSGLYQVYKVFPCSRLQRTWSGLLLTQGPLRDEASVPSEVQICNNTSGPSMHPQAAKRGFWKCLRANESYQTPHLMTEKTKIHACFFFSCDYPTYLSRFSSTPNIYWVSGMVPVVSTRGSPAYNWDNNPCPQVVYITVEELAINN